MECDQLCFFPIDNTSSLDSDSVIAQLRSKLAAVISAEPYIQRRVPFTWLSTLDRLRDAAGASCKSMTLKQVSDLAIECRVVEGHVELMLQLFSGLGFLMHHPEPSLRHLVILDPASFLVEPASRVVCCHRSASHSTEKHQLARKKLPSDYEKLESMGRVSSRLLRLILEDKQQHMNDLVQLMVQYGLMVPLLNADTGSQDDSVPGFYEYLVPAVLPHTDTGALMGILPMARAVFTFSDRQTLIGWRKRGFFTTGEAAKAGFLPAGLFAQVALSWFFFVLYFVPPSELPSCEIPRLGICIN